MTRDAFAARRYLVANGEDPSRMAVMGFSKGGSVSHFAADATFLPDEAERFQAAIPLYPACNSRVRQPRPVTPMFILLGEKDDYTGVVPCQKLAAAFEKAGGTVRVKVYPGASHAWDGDPRLLTSLRLPTAENYIDCFVDVEPDGKIGYMGRTYERGDTAVLAAMRATCMKKGVTIWTNPTQKQRATEDIIGFLNESFPAR
jgi:dienelactone hydrolase